MAEFKSGESMEHHYDPDLKSRLIALERGATTGETRIASVERDTADHTRRLGTLEEWRRQKDIEEAKQTTEWTAFRREINARIESLTTEIVDVKKPLQKIMYTIVVGFLLTLMALAWKSGFSISP